MATITILVDDRMAPDAPMGLKAEHGFAVAVDDVLFDTGQSGLAAHNARRLGRQTAFDTIILSHGHYDHTGGVPAFLHGAEKLYAHPAAFGSKFRDGSYIGMPWRRDRIEADVSVETHRESVEVRDGIVALGEIPREYPDNPTGQTVREDGEMGPDPLLDDQSLAIETDEGVLLVCGCCHAGLRNTVEHAETVTGTQVRGIVGGTHLSGLEPGDIEEVADWLDGRIDLLAPSHCTGPVGDRILASRFPDAYEFVGVGSEISYG